MVPVQTLLFGTCDAIRKTKLCESSAVLCCNWRDSFAPRAVLFWGCFFLSQVGYYETFILWKYGNARAQAAQGGGGICIPEGVRSCGDMALRDVGKWGYLR